MSTRRLMEELQSRQRRPTGGGRLTGGEGRQPASRAVSRSARAEPSRPTAGRSGGDIRRHPELPVRDPALLEQLKRSTPAKVGVGRAGLRYRTQTLMQFLADFALAKAAVESQVPAGWAEQHGLAPLQTAAENPEQFLARPDLGRSLSDASMEVVRARFVKSPDVQIVVGDGLSATAVMQNAPPMLQRLTAELQQRGRTVGTGAFVRHCRAKILDVIGQTVSAKVGIILIGERPGLGTGDGMSAYLVWDPKPERTDAEKQAISNIHRRGMLPEDAGAHAARLIEAILAQRTSGVGLDTSGIEAPQSPGRARINQAHPEPLAGCGQSHGQQCTQSANGLPGRVCNRTENRPCEVSTH